VERTLGWIHGREKPERSEGPREQEAPTRTKPSGSRKEYGFVGGRKPLKYRLEAGRFLTQVQEWRAGFEKTL